MVNVVRLGPLPLQRRREARVAELERIFTTDVHLVEVATVGELVTAVATPTGIAVAIDAARLASLTPPSRLLGLSPCSGHSGCGGAIIGVRSTRCSTATVS